MVCATIAVVFARPVPSAVPCAAVPIKESVKLLQTTPQGSAGVWSAGAAISPCVSPAT